METFDRTYGYYKSAHSILKLFIDKKNVANKDLFEVFSENNLTYRDKAVFNIMKKEGLINYNPIKDCYFVLDDILAMSDEEINNLCSEIADKTLKEARINQANSRNNSSLFVNYDAVAIALVIGGIIVGTLLFIIGFFIYFFAPLYSIFSGAIIMMVGACLTGICSLVSGVLDANYSTYIILFLLFLSLICVSSSLLAALYL